MKQFTTWGTLFLFLASVSLAQGEESPENLQELPTKGMVTMLDLGAHKCIPCKMMAPILEELKREYKGKAAIVFIDVWVHREEARKYGIRVIPTQIFFDRNGKEVFRHEGFMDKKSIVRMLGKLGVK
jgi:thioredoxin 1